MQSTAYTRLEKHRPGVECSQRTKDARKLWLTSKHKAQRPFRGTPLHAVPIFNHRETLSRPGLLCRVILTCPAYVRNHPDPNSRDQNVIAQRCGLTASLKCKVRGNKCSTLHKAC